MSFKTLAARLTYDGGNQLGRIKKNKLRSFQAALKNDYNSRTIKTPKHAAVQCLINSNNLKADYDYKTISVEFSAGLEARDTFECLDDGTHWMIYLPILTETAYLHSDIVRCRYTLNVDGVDYWIYFQGPTETDLRWFQKQGINTNELNLSGTIYIKKDKRTENFFRRFTHIKIAGHTWEVQVTDSITVPGIIELEIQEYYDNSIAELPEIIVQGCHEIMGLEEVEQNNTYGYMIRDNYYKPEYTWTIEDNPRVKIEDISEDGKQCTVKVHDGAIRNFRVIYGDLHSGYSMTVNIARRCKGIIGPSKVYPFDIIDYKTNVKGIFFINDKKKAQIIEKTDTTCKIEILSSKSGEFTLSFRPENDEEQVFELPVTIGSF